jgi:hypothetical protein
MANTNFNIFIQARTQIAADVLAQPALLATFEAKGAMPGDWQQMKQHGEDADGFSRERQAASLQLKVLNEGVSQAHAAVREEIAAILLRREGVLELLRKDPACPPDDILFVETLSFAVPAPKKKAELTKLFGEEKKARPRESDAADARQLQLRRLVEEVKKRPRVLAAFAGRGLSEEGLDAVAAAASALGEAVKLREEMYKLWLAMGAAERDAVSDQNRAWKRVSRIVTRMSRSVPEAKEILRRLAEAREKARLSGPKKA